MAEACVKKYYNRILCEDELPNAVNLLSTLTDDFPRHTYKGQCMVGKAVSIYDGDTIDIVIWVETERMFKRFRCRLEGFDAPEIRPLKSVNNREIVKKQAVQCKEYLWSLVRPIDRNPLLMVKCGEYDKYGRLLTVIERKYDGLNINNEMKDYVNRIIQCGVNEIKE